MQKFPPKWGDQYHYTGPPRARHSPMEPPTPRIALPPARIARPRPSWPILGRPRPAHTSWLSAACTDCPTRPAQHLAHHCTSTAASTPAARAPPNAPAKGLSRAVRRPAGRRAQREPHAREISAIAPLALPAFCSAQKLDARARAELIVNVNAIALAPPRSREATGAIKPRRLPFRHPNEQP